MELAKDKQKMKLMTHSGVKAELFSGGGAGQGGGGQHMQSMQ